jgi:superfamily II DNA/RNA helicase
MDFSPGRIRSSFTAFLHNDPETSQVVPRSVISRGDPLMFTVGIRVPLAQSVRGSEQDAPDLWEARARSHFVGRAERCNEVQGHPPVRGPPYPICNVLSFDRGRLMDVFALRQKLVDDYRSFTSSFVDVLDDRIRAHVESQFERGAQWPEPWVSLNPAFASGGTISELITAGLLHEKCERIFRIKQDPEDLAGRTLTLHRHQRDAIEIARTGASYVLTTGTGSGKSLAYIIPIVDHVLRLPRTSSVKAIVVYPMNALANSQVGELEKFLRFGYGPGREPVTFARYTGQESLEERDAILRNPPDILLTNYVMLELVLTRPHERERLIRAAEELQFLVLDELHTYRGRQGADVAMLVRRTRDSCDAPNLQCVGTSATMASGGKVEDQRLAVADVATSLFGTSVIPEHVVIETLERATSPTTPTNGDLTAAVRGRQNELTYDDFIAHPLAAWVEGEFGLEDDPASRRLVRRKPTTIADAAAELARLTSEPLTLCGDAIRAALRAGSALDDPRTGRPLFAFRLHQFLSKGDTVYVSLEPEETRYITDRYQLVVPEQPEKLLLPLAFCRECGQEYHAVAMRERDGHKTFEARRERDASGGDAVNGYLFTSSDHPWPDDPITEGRLPDSWLAMRDDGSVEVLASRRKHLPRIIWVTPDGAEAGPGTGVRSAYVPSPFSFCLRCGVAYEQRRGADFAKLASLDAEGRSSATTIIATSIVRGLRADSDPTLSHARKLLTFVDNRQDASLQAGHFNDFVQVAQLRGALYRAASDSTEGIVHEDFAKNVATALALPFHVFARNPEARFSQRDNAERALREVIGYRLLIDLERGWRITMPNLEQTGLLVIDYMDLHEISADQDCWEGAHPSLSREAPGKREELARIILDEMRRGLAIDVVALTPEGFETIRNLSSQHLKEPWALPEREEPPQCGVAYPRPGRPGGSRRDLTLSGRSALGRYIQKRWLSPGRQPTADEAQEILRDALQVLERFGLLTIAIDDDVVPGYRLKASAIRWTAGGGTSGARDPLRKDIDPDADVRVNRFFRDLYREVAAELTGLHAAEHTAQVPADVREGREKSFRTAELPLLFCSPTMELGVDIAGLNAVALRNAPPTPANYAQRSGRAGRSGQPALVTTYCATGNNHDHYYFRRSRDMVAGSVIPPRLDLTNEDLVRSHVHAVWLAETGQSLHARLTELLDVGGENPSLQLLPEVRAALEDGGAQRRAAERARKVLDGLRILHEATSWWHESWIEESVQRSPAAFDIACDRWRDLYRDALADQREQNRIILDQSVSAQARRRAEGRRREAENQMRLLRNEDSERGQTDFYSYRYFASEGFLPGYSFPRLPLAAYIPGIRARASDGDYIQRPRFLAVSEFGPGAVIYHEGARYQVTRVQLPVAGPGQSAIDTVQARRCQACGYHHEREAGIDNCEHCGQRLGAPQPNLMRLQTVFTRRRERISSDEEERRRSGFELETSYRFNDHGSRPGRIDSDVSDRDAVTLATMTYGDTATVRIANVGRRRRKDHNDIGFWIDTVEGRWLSDKQAADSAPDEADLTATDDAPRRQKVIPYVEDRRNVLVFRLIGPVDRGVAVSLMYALERGIEAQFELEDSELTAQLLPDADGRGRMIFIESAEGGAGVLRRLQAEPPALAQAARRALAIAHFDPESGTDLGAPEGASERCERACYDCLLSYSNQLDHAAIDRHLIADLLVHLANGTTTTGAGGTNADDIAVTLERRCDTELERRWLRWLLSNDYRLPDDAQVLLDEAAARPDFVYRNLSQRAAIFVDGPIHEYETVGERDRAAEERLMDYGWTVIRFPHDADWDEIARRFGSIFGTGRRQSA